MGLYPIGKPTNSTGSVNSRDNPSAFKQFFLDRGFIDIEVDYSKSTVKYCRVDIVKSTHPIFMGPVNSRVKIYISPYAGLGRNNDGTIKNDTTPIFSRNVPITKFYEVRFASDGGLSDPYYGTGFVEKDEKGGYVRPPRVARGSDSQGEGFRLDLIYIFFLFETPFTTDSDIQDYLCRKYMATKTNQNSTDSSIYSGRCSMAELATVLGFSDVKHSNTSKDAFGTAVKIYERVTSSKVAYAFCFGKEDHDKSTMSGYSNLLTTGEAIIFTETSGKYINWKNGSGGSGGEMGPGAGSGNNNKITQQFDKSMHVVDRVKYVQPLAYVNPTISNAYNSLNDILTSLGCFDITGVSNWSYDVDTNSGKGVTPIVFKIKGSFDAIKTSGSSSPENPSYGYKDNNGYFTLPFNFLTTDGTTTYYHVQFNKVALCTNTNNLFGWYNKPTTAHRRLYCSTADENQYALEYNLGKTYTSHYYKINDEVFTIPSNKLIRRQSIGAPSSGVFSSDATTSENYKYGGQQPDILFKKLGDNTENTTGSETDDGGIMIGNRIYYSNDHKKLIYVTREPELQETSTTTCQLSVYHDFYSSRIVSYPFDTTSDIKANLKFQDYQNGIFTTSKFNLSCLCSNNTLTYSNSFAARDDKAELDNKDSKYSADIRTEFLSFSGTMGITYNISYQTLPWEVAPSQMSLKRTKDTYLPFGGHDYNSYLYDGDDYVYGYPLYTWFQAPSAIEFYNMNHCIEGQAECETTLLNGMVPTYLDLVYGRSFEIFFNGNSRTYTSPKRIDDYKINYFPTEESLQDENGYHTQVLGNIKGIQRCTTPETFKSFSSTGSKYLSACAIYTTETNSILTYNHPEPQTAGANTMYFGIYVHHPRQKEKYEAGILLDIADPSIEYINSGWDDSSSGTSGGSSSSGSGSSSSGSGGSVSPGGNPHDPLRPTPNPGVTPAPLR